MIFLRRPLNGALSFLLCLSLTGCFLAGENQLDEKKEAHFLKGLQRRSNMDYKGAIEAFEKALVINPRSASAHWELALLSESEADYAAAIYHYDRVLLLRPPPNDDKRIKEHVEVCKVELAKTVSIGPVSPSVQRELERLHTLEVENVELKRQLAYYESRRLTATNPPTLVPSTSPTGNSSATSQSSPATSVQSNPTVTLHQPTPAIVKAHSVKAGETPSSIAKKYGVSVTALMAANPGVEARRLRIGQTLKLPAP
jgi:LysM repeat protein